MGEYEICLTLHGFCTLLECIFRILRFGSASKIPQSLAYMSCTQPCHSLSQGFGSPWWGWALSAAVPGVVEISWWFPSSSIPEYGLVAMMVDAPIPEYSWDSGLVVTPAFPYHGDAMPDKSIESYNIVTYLFTEVLEPCT